MRAREARRTRRTLFALALLIAAVGGALFVVASGRWRGIYAFFVQFHQQTLWTALLALSIPALLVVLLRSWGIEDVPYVEEAPQLGSGRLKSLVRRIGRSPRDPYGQALLIDELCESATLVAALNEGLDPSVVRKLCRTGGVPEDDPVLRDLIADRKLSGNERDEFLARFRTTLDSIESALKGGPA